MSYRDSLIQMNLDDATDVVFSYTTERDVWFTEDVNEEDTIVNRTDSFDVWWTIVNAPGFEQHLRNALLNAVEFVNIETESPEEIDLSRAIKHSRIILMNSLRIVSAKQSDTTISVVMSGEFGSFLRNGRLFVIMTSFGRFSMMPRENWRFLYTPMTVF